MNSRKEKYPSNKPKILIFIDKYLNMVINFWDNYSGGIILGVLFAIILAIPGWLYLIFG